MNTLIERARVLWPALEGVEFVAHLGKGKSTYQYGLVDRDVRIVKVIQYVPEDFAEEELLEQMAMDVSAVLGKDYTTVLREIRSLCAE